MDNNVVDGHQSILSKLPVAEQVATTELEDYLSEIKNKTTDFIHKNPLTSIAIAVGVGYALAKILSGKRS